MYRPKSLLIVFSILAMFILVLSACGGTNNSTSQPTKTATHSQPTQQPTPVSSVPPAKYRPKYVGFYAGCSPHPSSSNPELCNTQLQNMGTHGFNAVLNYASLKGSIEEIHTYANN